MEQIINKLKQSNCIKQGYFLLRNGEPSNYYFDMKNLVSHPELLEIGDMIYIKFIKDKLSKYNDVNLWCTFRRTTNFYIYFN